MFERSEALLKILCAGLGALILWQAVHAVQRSNPLAGTSIPPLPSLPGATNGPAEAKGPTPQPGGGSGTNANPPAVAAARGLEGMGDTGKLGGLTLPGKLGTNAVRDRVHAPAGGSGTNGQRSATGALAAAKSGRNMIALGTNAVGRVRAARAGGTNALASVPETGATGAVQKAVAMTGDTSLVAGVGSDLPAPSARKAKGGRGDRPGAGPGMFMAGGPGMPGQSGPPLPPAIQARLDRIVESELLAPMMHPQPVALLGIIGSDAVLQAPNGQSGLVKEGDESGGIKLLKLGINRALIEEAGEQKELTLFSGLGSDSLLSKPTNSSK